MFFKLAICTVSFIASFFTIEKPNKYIKPKINRSKLKTKSNSKTKINFSLTNSKSFLNWISKNWLKIILSIVIVSISSILIYKAIDRGGGKQNKKKSKSLVIILFDDSGPGDIGYICNNKNLNQFNNNKLKNGGIDGVKYDNWCNSDNSNKYKCNLCPYTPNLDKFLKNKNSVIMKNIITSPTCTPSRATLLSGRFTYSSKSQGNCLSIKGLDPRNNYEALPVPTFAESFKKNNWNTSYFGKWHVGSYSMVGPHNKNFTNTLWTGQSWDYNPCFPDDTGVPNTNCRNQYPCLSFLDKETIVSQPVDFKNANEILIENAYKQYKIDKENNKNSVIVLGLLGPHHPMVRPNAGISIPNNLNKNPIGVIMNSMDTSLKDFLNDLGNDPNAAVMLTSDNGPSLLRSPQHHGSAAGRRCGKFTPWNGGTSVWGILYSSKLSHSLSVDQLVYPHAMSLRDISITLADLLDYDTTDLKGKSYRNDINKFIKNENTDPPVKDIPIFWGSDHKFDIRGSYVYSKNNWYKVLFNPKPSGLLKKKGLSKWVDTCNVVHKDDPSSNSYNLPNWAKNQGIVYNIDKDPMEVDFLSQEESSSFITSINWENSCYTHKQNIYTTSKLPQCKICDSMNQNPLYTGGCPQNTNMGYKGYPLYNPNNKIVKLGSKSTYWTKNTCEGLSNLKEVDESHKLCS